MRFAFNDSCCKPGRSFQIGYVDVFILPMGRLGLLTLSVLRFFVLHINVPDILLGSVNNEAQKSEGQNQDVNQERFNEGGAEDD